MLSQMRELELIGANTTANNYTGEGARSRAYAGAGTYTGKRVINARALTYVNLNSAILVNF